MVGLCPHYSVILSGLMRNTAADVGYSAARLGSDREHLCFEARDIVRFNPDKALKTPSTGDAFCWLQNMRRSS